MKKTIRRRAPAQDSGAFAGDLPLLLKQVYGARGVRCAADLDLGLHAMLPATGLRGLDDALSLLQRCLELGACIVVVGDYDADGATASALSVLALRRFGAGPVQYLVPDRFAGGYGLSAEIVDEAAARGARLIITVDNGIGSLRGVARANEREIPVIVTDHHLPGERLPAAAAIVNPNQGGDEFPSKHLAGVGVAFYLMLALRARLRDGGWFRRRGMEEPNMAEFLDLVALGTVADLVRLDRNNRILVEQGLRRIRAGRCRPGITALVQVAGRDAARLTAGDLGFSVGPRLNAAGRLDDMALGIECLLEDDVAVALDYAVTLDGLNRSRQEIEAEMKVQADAAMAELTVNGDDLPLGLCLFDERWHQGVIGILASRIKDRYHRPVIALAGADEDRIKGSARSVPGLHMRDLLATLDSRHPGLIERYGGHAMAAGMTLPRASLDAFRAAFEAEVSAQFGGQAPEAELLTDGELEPAQLDEVTARLLRYAGPWGQGFPEPLFDGEFQVLSRRFVGDRHLKLELSPDGVVRVDAIAFRWGEREAPGDRVRAVYRLDLNAFRGVEGPQLIVEHLEDLAGPDPDPSP